MTLSAPARERIWKDAARRPVSSFSGSFELSFPWTPDPISVEIPGSVAVIFGKNATGKSRALTQLHSSILAGKAITVRLHELCEWLRETYSTRSDLVDAKDEYEAVELSEPEADGLAAVVGRRYDTVAWYTLEIEDSPFEPLVGSSVMPLMEVEYQGGRYHSLDMGLGELSAHIIFWLLNYFRGSGPTVILLDEPDAFLPDSSSELLAAELLSWAKRAGGGVVMTTHCHELATIAARHNALHILTRNANKGTSWLSGETARQALNLTYAGPSREPTIVAFCEDESAVRFSKELWRRIGDLPQAEFIWVNGVGDLEVLHKVLHGRSGKFLYIFDGDQSSRPELNGKSRTVFLPDPSPDACFRRLASRRVDALAAEFRVPVEAVELRLEELEGTDDHDWTTRVVQLASSRSAGIDFLARLSAELLEEDVCDDFALSVASALS